jgi:hypothetical protein
VRHAVVSGSFRTGGTVGLKEFCELRLLGFLRSLRSEVAN